MILFYEINKNSSYFVEITNMLKHESLYKQVFKKVFTHICEAINRNDFVVELC